MNKKAFLQYLSSISNSGIAELPRGDDSIKEKISQAFELTKEIVESQTPDPTELDRTELGPTAAIPAETKTLSTKQRLSLPEKESQLEILNNEVRGCNQCKELVENRIQTVFGVGDPDARLCFMGEAPGADEDRQGEPFVGAAGQLLDRIINACKMRREDVYILNTLKCRPPNNRNPTDLECDNCRPFLDRQLEILSPEFICCLGGIAAKHLLNSELSVGKLRGKLHYCSGIPVVVTYHPAYLLRNPDAKKLVWDDMKFLMNEMGHDIS